MEERGNWQRPDRETIVFTVFLAVMALYYGWRMFALTPWYDELYTYYYFISRGPFYAAIHWPLPNNHIGYSVLSACLGIFGNSAVALRGISYLCSLGSLILLFKLGRKWFVQGMALIPVFSYAGMHMVNQLAVQGRGYALVTFCYLVSLFELYGIITKENDRIRNYALFGISLVMALYAIPSSLYVVVPVCLIGGTALLMERDYQRLLRLIVTALASAAGTLLLYGIVWLAIGSNLLTKTEESAYYGISHGSILLHAPFAALKTGVEYMLATPYIQSVGREGFFKKFAGWLKNLLNEYYSGGYAALAVIIITTVMFLAGSFVKRYYGNIRRQAGSSGHSGRMDPGKRMTGGEDFVEIYLAGSILGIPLMLILLCSLPYYRVFSFAGVVAAFAITWWWQAMVRYLQGVSSEKLRQAGRLLPVSGSVLGALLCASLLASPSYRVQYSDREAAIEDAYAHVDLAQDGPVCVTDCDQEYLLLFLYGMGEESITKAPEEAQIVLADKFLLLGYETRSADWMGDDWKLYLSPEQFKESGVFGRMEAVYENDRFVLYRRREEF